jgi:CRP/FNR family cyclic AMP-dependent transcriptional regulator
MSDNREPHFMANKAFLQEHALFGGFSDEDLGVVLPLLAEESFAEGEEIVREGEMGDRLYFIERGCVEILKRSGGKDCLIATLRSGDAFGEMEVIDVQARSATVRATEPVFALTLRHRDMLHLYRKNLDVFARLLLNVARELSRRLRKMDERAC